jgi:hypothetical protein
METHFRSDFPNQFGNDFPNDFTYDGASAELPAVAGHSPVVVSDIRQCFGSALPPPMSAAFLFCF